MDLFGDLPDPSSNGNESTGLPLGGGDAEVPASGGEKRKLETPDNEPPEKKQATGYYTLSCCVAERRGEREEMQDAHTLLPDLLSSLKDTHSNIKRVSYFAVFDGHGGARASSHAASNLHTTLMAKFPKGDVPQVEKDIRKSFTESFKKTDDDFLKMASKNKPTWKDGSTAVCVLAINNVLFVANLGDSKAVLCRYSESLGKCVAISLTKDHSPSLYNERIRIQKAGGHVRDGRVMGQLEVSRSIGDGPYKRHGVSCVPDVKRCQLTCEDRFILVACDGLWKRFTNESAIEFVYDILKDESLVAKDGKSELETRYEVACNRLANEAVRRLSQDNVTVLLIRIDTQ